MLLYVEVSYMQAVMGNLTGQKGQSPRAGKGRVVLGGQREKERERERGREGKKK